jgi:hypothetical protein
MRTIALCALLMACGGQTANHEPDAGTTTPAPTATVGGACLVNVDGDCYQSACRAMDGGWEAVTRTPINDAGADACEGIAPWP